MYSVSLLGETKLPGVMRLRAKPNWLYGVLPSTSCVVPAGNFAISAML